MKIGIQTWGSHGDIRPFVALARGLQAAGHHVTLVLTCVDSDRYGALVAGPEVEIRVVATPVVPDALRLERSAAALLQERNPIRQTQLAIEEFLLPAELEMYRASERLCSENDLVIGHYFVYTLGAAAEKLQCPYVSIVLAHGAVPSAFQPPSGVPDFGARCNRLAWRFARWVLNRSLKKYPDGLRARNGVAPARDMIDCVWASRYLTLLAISPAICERQPDWPAHYQVSGSLDSPESIAEGGVDPPLQRFLSGGVAPVYLTFGSMMSGSNESDAIALLTAAARAASIRAIIQAPNWETLGFECTGHIHYVASAPHAAVFPRCSAVVHHGGAGTSHAALRAGLPSVVVPHTAEQALWARELERLGVAGEAIARERATPERIAAAMVHVVGCARLREKATALGVRVAEEQGVTRAVELIEGRFRARSALAPGPYGGSV